MSGSPSDVHIWLPCDLQIVATAQYLVSNSAEESTLIAVGLLQAASTPAQQAQHLLEPAILCLCLCFCPCLLGLLWASLSMGPFDVMSMSPNRQLLLCLSPVVTVPAAA